MELQNPGGKHKAMQTKTEVILMKKLEKKLAKDLRRILKEDKNLLGRLAK